MKRHIASPAKYRAEDRVLFIGMPLLALNGILIWGFAHFHWHPAGLLAVACAVVFCLPAFALMAGIALYLREETDEFEKAVLAESLLWGAGITVTGIVFWIDLEQFAHVPKPDLIWVLILFVAALAVGRIVARWRYR
jgi:hypothetical protein